MWDIYIYIYIEREREREREEYYSAIKRNRILPFTITWMDLQGIILSEINQTEIDKYCMISLIHGIWKIKQTSDNKTRNRHTDTENTLVITSGEREGRRGKMG